MIRSSQQGWRNNFNVAGLVRVAFALNYTKEAFEALKLNSLLAGIWFIKILISRANS